MDVNRRDLGAILHQFLPAKSHLQATLDLIPAYAWYANPRGALTFVNDRSADFLGLPADHPLRFGAETGADWDSHIAFLHPDDREQTRIVWSECLHAGSAGEVSFRVRAAAGTYRWFLSRAEPVRDASGTLLYWIGINLDIEDRKRAEQELRDIVNTIPAIAWVALPDGSNTYVNPRFVEYSGMVSADTAGSGWRAAVHPDDLERHEGRWRASVASGEPHESEVRFRRTDGQYRWHLDRGRPMRDDDGNVIKWYGVVTDIEDRKRVEEALRRNEHFLAEAQRLSHTGSFGWNVTTDEHFWSVETFRIFEFALSSKVSLPLIMERIHPDDLSLVNTAIAAATGGDRIDFDHRLLMADGRIKYLHIVGEPKRSGSGGLEIIGAVMDLSPQKETEIELRRSRAYLADAQRLSRTGCVGMDATTKRIFWSDEAARIYGYPPGTDPTPDLILQRSHPDDVGLVKDALERAAHGEEDFDYEHRLLMPDGSIKHLHDLAHSVRDGAGNEEIVGAIMDITERKVAEEAIRRQEAELRQILDLTPQLIAVFGPRRERLFVNRMALDYFALTLDEWRNTAHGFLGHPEDAKRVQTQWNRAMSSGSGFEMEVRMRKGDGTFRWFLNRFNPLQDDAGQVLRWYVACTDIEDRKQSEEKLQQENVALREEIDKASMFEEIVGTSPPLQTVLSRISKVAPTDSTVLITGETGTGKELVARAIHRRSNRASRAFISVNCAAIPRDLIASELFGHEKGSFTGALQRRIGRFQLADGGTIFLDEVGELSPETQVALLRVLQEREFELVGGRQPIHVDVRVIAATNRDLKAAVASGNFREDLYYRLNVFPLEVPPLRERRSDIPLMVEYFIDRYARKAGKRIRNVDKKTLRLLESYPWPGNIRELQNVIERSMIVCESETFTVDERWLSQIFRNENSGRKLYFSQKLKATEKEVIEEALRETQGRVSGPSGAAAILGIARSTLESKILSLDINKNRFRAKPRS